MKMGEAVTVYISYRMSLGEKARTLVMAFLYMGGDRMEHDRPPL